MKKRLFHLLTEFLMVFFGVLFAFWVNEWGERKRNEEYTASIVRNISDDIRNDSLQIEHAIQMIKTQVHELNIVTNCLRKGDFESANSLAHVCYFSYQVFEPNSDSYQSLIYGGDLKFMSDINLARLIKEIDHTNQKLKRVRDLYHKSVDDIKNNYVSKVEMTDFDFRKIENRLEFWNRLRFLEDNYLQNYAMVLLECQYKYNQFLSLSQNPEKANLKPISREELVKQILELRETI